MPSFRRMTGASQGENEPLQIRAGLVIPRAELVLRATRAGGPGGQHVNTSSTRIEVLWNVRSSAVLDDAARARLEEKLAKRIDSDGWLRVVASESRSQLRNRKLAEERLTALVRQALVIPRKRRATRPPKSANENRIREKQLLSRKKSERRKGRDLSD